MRVGVKMVTEISGRPVFISDFLPVKPYGNGNRPIKYGNGNRNGFTGILIVSVFTVFLWKLPFLIICNYRISKYVDIYRACLYLTHSLEFD